MYAIWPVAPARSLRSASWSFQGREILEQVGGLLGRQVAEQPLRHQRRWQRGPLLDLGGGDADRLVPGIAQDQRARRLLDEQPLVDLAIRRRDRPERVPGVDRTRGLED